MIYMFNRYRSEESLRLFITFPVESSFLGELVMELVVIESFLYLGPSLLVDVVD